MKKLLLAALIGIAGLAQARPPHGGGWHPARPVHPVVPGPRPHVVVRPPRVVVRPPPVVVVRPAPYVRIHPRPYRPVVRVVPALPLGFVALSVGAASYYYADGAFYSPAPGGYQVVSAPLGASVVTLPYGAQQQVIDGETYAFANGTWFHWDGWRAAWIVVNQPY
ncbi:MAG: DUF6515 family protein [Archangium sp.]